MFFLSVASALWVGGTAEGTWYHPRVILATMATGWKFAVPLFAILLAHEFGHYIAARIHGVRASLPYFLPMPLSPLGTWGAIIGMPDRIATPRALLDIGAAGPLAGFVVALPVLVLGLSWSEVKPLTGPGLIEGQSLLYLLLKRAVLGPVPPGHDVFLHPTAFAGWAGFFVTMINLVPSAQLDGGHIAYALLGPRQNRVGELVYKALPVLFLVVFAYNLRAARIAPATPDSESYVFSNSAFWMVWFIVLTFIRRFGGRDHPPTDEGHSLDPVRRGVAVLCLILFVLLFMPTLLSRT